MFDHKMSQKILKEV